MDVYVKTQAELDAIPPDTKDIIYIKFGTEEKPAVVKRRYRYPVRIANDSVVTTHGNTHVGAYNNSIVCACDNSIVWARGNSIVYTHGNSNVSAYDNSQVWTYDNSKVCAYHNGKVLAHDNSIVCVWDDSQVWAYDNSQVRAHNDKCIASVNDNAIVISPNIFCSGAELLNQCNGNIDNVQFTVSNIPDEKKDSVFDKIYTTNGRVFILTMRGVPYYCIYNFNTMSVRFYTMNFCRAFSNIADDAVLSYYLDNALIPTLVNTKFDKSAKSNII